MARTAIIPAPKVSRSAPATPSVWGLTPVELHDAYWRARGIQCVRRGRRVEPDRDAEMYLLLDPGLLVVFDLGRLRDRLTWHGAPLTRLRLDDADDDAYSEHVVVDDDGLVQRVERRYQPSVVGRRRVMLTTRRAIAEQWMAAPSHRVGWTVIRRRVPRGRIDYQRMTGRLFHAGDATQERRLLEALVAQWPEPDQAIAGLEEIEPGVWAAAGTPLADDVVRVGPLWLGFGAERAGHDAMFGPAWCADLPGAEHDPGQAGVRVRSIGDVSIAERGFEAEDADPGSAYPVIKRAIDVVVSATGLVVTAPLLVLIALLIVLQDGRPVLFGHRRQGRGGRPFRCWKFRTMHQDAERMARDLEAYNVCDGPQVFIVDDPRVTRLGHLLRRTQLDEVPQLWNVLIGQMSLVGPRPSPERENQFCPPWRDSRLSVRPGITGLWQLKRTREPGEDFQEWIRYDIEYVRRASLRLDLSILLRTARLVLLGRDRRETQ